MTITVPATSANLGPGFDTLGMSIQIRNTINIKPSKFHSVSIKGEGSKGNNMFLTIFNSFFNNLVSQQEHFRYEFNNLIPLSRGLGSSSAVITSAIASAYCVAKVELSKEDLLNFALSYESHPDNIAPAVMGGFTVSTVENNQVKVLKKNMPDDIQAIVVIPNRQMSTNQSRKIMPLKYSKEDAVFNIAHSSMLTGAIFSENWDYLRLASQDVFHQEFRMKNMPELFNVQRVSLENGSLMSTLSGSGSTFFNLAHKSDAQHICSVLRKKFPQFKIMVHNLDNDGITIDN